MTPRDDTISTPSSGNVFADLGLPDAEQRLAKAELARQVASLIRERRYTQPAAARKLGIDQPKVSTLLAGRLVGFSLDQLVHLLRLVREVSDKEFSQVRTTEY
jgi:predicted XRE-type DNA-binding protein